MVDALNRLFRAHREAIYLLLRALIEPGRPFLPWHEIRSVVERWRESEAARSVPPADVAWLEGVQEAVVAEPLVHLAVRGGVARWTHLQVHVEEVRARSVSIGEYLAAKENVVLEPTGEERYTLEVDLAPFERGSPKLSDPAEIGRGVEFLNRRLSGRLFANDAAEGERRLLEFLRSHATDSRTLMLSEAIEDVRMLRRALRRAMAQLRSGRWEDERTRLLGLRQLGFEPGWGGTPERALDTMQLLCGVLDSPSPENLQRFLARLPMIFSIVIVSPHGFFGQANVLGKPDTGGQVVYILDQVRALEKAMRASIRESGLDVEPGIVVLTRLIPEAEGTSCNVRLEPIIGTESARILRVPFRDRTGEVLPRWVSRFDVWPYLERFALEAEREVLAELGSPPDFVVGNYSDGNLVASILARRLQVTQCNIAHALEKTKYEQADLRWQQHEEEHHFACQFTADLISMNTADFIITSTYQEIAGTEETVGQYESYGSFTLPGLYRMLAGVDCFDPKFNIVSPGADPEVFFPYTRIAHRPHELTEEVSGLAFGETDVRHRGTFADPDRPVLFAMSRLDPIKNMAGLLEWYAESDELRAGANLLLVGGCLEVEGSADDEERREIVRMHDLFDRYDLDGSVRWLEMQANKNRVGELYRVVADTRGAFVQPALFEAFGLTVIEAMSSGLPVFATRFGGPLETIEEGVSGFHIDPTRGDEAAAKMHSFLRSAREDPGSWERISEGAVRRVEERYNWPLYASRLLELSRIYGFWRYITDIDREDTRRYLDMFYGLMYRPLAASVGQAVRAELRD